MSLKKIAELTGASISTISRVLNQPDYHCQNEEMTEKIRQVARELNYIPNINAKQLKTGSVKKSDAVFKVDILLARFDTLKKDAFFKEIFRYLETEFLNQNCVIHQVLKVPDCMGSAQTSNRTKDEGLIILGKCSIQLVNELQRRYKAVVAIDRNPTEYQMDEVVCNGARAAAIAVEYLLELGHQKIAYIGDCNMESRYSGYYECLLQHKIPLVYDYVVSTGQTREEGYRAYEQLMNYEKQPTAVFCANDVTALGFLEAMKIKNGKKRKNIYRPAVISIDDIEEASFSNPMLSTVHIPKEDMVHMAVMILRDRLQGGHTEYMRLELPSHLMIRESSGFYVS